MGWQRRRGVGEVLDERAVLRMSFARSSSATRRFSARTSSVSTKREAGGRDPTARSSASTQLRIVAGLMSNSAPT